MDCSLSKLPPVHHPLCASTFDLLSLRPTSTRRFPVYRRGHLHLFDLFRNQKDSRNCFELNFMFAFQDDVQNQLLHVGISCQGKGKLMFIYESSNIWSSRCIDPVPINRACNYHAHEQLRFTAIGNDTMLVEDLSSFAPPGTRMIFRTSGKSLDQDQKSDCKCRNLLRDKRRLERCIRYHQEQTDNEVQIRQGRERIVKEFRIGLAILVASCSGTVFVRCWATRKVTDFDYISNFVYAWHSVPNVNTASREKRQSKCVPPIRLRVRYSRKMVLWFSEIKH